jgi:hypothetical protein
MGPDTVETASRFADRARGLFERLRKWLSPDRVAQTIGIGLKPELRARFILVGSALMILGLYTPWYVLIFGPPGNGVRLRDGKIISGSANFINAFQLRSASIIHGWITLKTKDPAILHGVSAVFVAALAAALVGVLMLLANAGVPRRLKPAQNLLNTASAHVVERIMSVIHIGLIYAFILQMWWFCIENGFEVSVRNAIYAYSGGGRFGAELALSIGTIPFFGFFFTVAGICIAAVGLWTVDPAVQRIGIAETAQTIGRGAREARRLTGEAVSAVWNTVYRVVIYLFIGAILFGLAFVILGGFARPAP